MLLCAQTLLFIKLFQAYQVSGSSQIVRGEQIRDSGRQVSVVARNHSKTYGCKLIPFIMLIIFGGSGNGAGLSGAAAL